MGKSSAEALVKAEELLRQELAATSPSKGVDQLAESVRPLAQGLERVTERHTTEMLHTFVRHRIFSRRRLRHATHASLADFVAWETFRKSNDYLLALGCGNAFALAAVIATYVDIAISGREPSSPGKMEVKLGKTFDIGGIDKYGEHENLQIDVKDRAAWLLGKELGWILRGGPQFGIVDTCAILAIRIRTQVHMLFDAIVLRKAPDPAEAEKIERLVKQALQSPLT